MAKSGSEHFKGKRGAAGRKVARMNAQRRTSDRKAEQAAVPF
jgi:hypothetical protein